MEQPSYAFVTLVTTDYYLPGALVLVAALRDLHPSGPLKADGEIDPSDFHVVCLVTPETVTVQTLKLLRRAFDVVIGVEIIHEDTEENLALLGRPDLETVLTKLHVFRLSSYTKIIYLDADVLPLLPLSHLFKTTSAFAAVPDVGWPDIFNSGVLVFSPGDDMFNEILALVTSEGSWDGGDQGVLNEWRGNDWERLSFAYNTTPTGAYTYAPAYKRFGSEIKAVHFIGPNKPWSQLPYRAPGSSSIDESFDSLYSHTTLFDRWFAVFDKHYRSEQPIFSTTGELLPTAFQEKIYKNVWDAGKNHSTLDDSGGPLGLEGLKRLAVVGLGQTPIREHGEGAYMTLPLAGRIDLTSRPRSQLRSLFAPNVLDQSLLFPSNAPDSPQVTTPVDCLTHSFSELQTTSDQGHSAEHGRWDPWNGTYANMWDLVPTIHKVALHHFKNTNNPKKEAPVHNAASKLQGGQETVYRSWEDKVESTSRDGDDEADDEDSEDKN